MDLFFLVIVGNFVMVFGWIAFGDSNESEQRNLENPNCKRVDLFICNELQMFAL